MRYLRFIVSFASLLTLASCGRSNRVNNVRVIREDGSLSQLERTVPIYNSRQMAAQSGYSGDAVSDNPVIFNDPTTDSMRMNNVMQANSVAQLQQPNNITNSKFDAKLPVASFDSKPQIPDVVRSPQGVGRRNPSYNEPDLPPDTFSDANDQSDNLFILKNEKREKELRKALLSDNSLSEESAIDLNKYGSNIKSNDKIVSTSTSVSDDDFIIQLGAYKSRDNADKIADAYSDIGNIEVRKSSYGDGVSVFKVLMGGYSSKESAESSLEKIVSRGHYDVFITRNH